MTQKTSPRKVAANRRNAQKSTGPKTPEGKARVSRNRTRHGLCSRDLILRAGPNAESPAEFAELLDELQKDMRPCDSIEQGLVLRIAVTIWRQRRAWRYEVGATTDLVSAAEAQGPTDPRIVKLDQQIGAARDKERLHSRFLARAQTDPPPDDANSCEMRMVALRDAARSRDLPDSAARDPQMIPKLVEILRESVLKHHETAERLQCERAELLAEQQEHEMLSYSLPDAASVAKLTRYENMLDRQLHRALAEFRRHRSARAMLNSYLASLTYDQAAAISEARMARVNESRAASQPGSSSVHLDEPSGAPNQLNEQDDQHSVDMGPTGGMGATGGSPASASLPASDDMPEFSPEYEHTLAETYDEDADEETQTRREKAA